MASRQIAIKITVESAAAVSATQAQTNALRGLGIEQAKISQLQEGLTNSFIKGNLAARAISTAYMSMKDSVGFVVGGLSDLELTLARVQAVTGVSKTATDGLSATIFKLGRDTSSSIKDISGASLELAKLGFAGKDLEIVLGGVSRLSSALGDSLEATGQLVGGVVNTFDLSSEQAATVADKLFVATGRSAASIDSFKVAFGLAGNVAANAGVSFEELSAVIATLSNQGIRASTIGTGLRTFITNLSMDGSEAQKVLGGSFEEMGLLGAMERLAKIKPDPGSISEMFGRPGSPVATALMSSTGMYKEFLSAVENGNGSLVGAGDIINDTLIGSTIRLKNATLELFSVWSTTPLGAMKDFFSTLAQGLNQTTDDTKDQTKVNDFIKKHIDEAKTAQAGMQNAARELGFGKDDSFTDDEFKSAFLRRENQNKVRNDSFLLIAKKLQEDENRKLGINQPDDSPRPKRDLKAEEDAKKAAKKLADFVADSKTDFNPDAVFDKLDSFANDRGDTYKEVFDANRDKKRGKESDKEGKESAKETLLLMKQLNPEIQTFLENMSIGFIAFDHGLEATKIGFNSLGESVDLFAQDLTKALFFEKDPFKNFGDSFKELAKGFVAQIIAMELRILAFKAAISIFSLFTGGPAASLIPGAATMANLAASGTDRIVTKPTMFMAGESGKERVTVTPRAKMSGGDGSGITVVIQGDVMDGAKFTEAVEMAQKRIRGRSA